MSSLDLTLSRIHSNSLLVSSRGVLLAKLTVANKRNVNQYALLPIFIGMNTAALNSSRQDGTEGVDYRGNSDDSWNLFESFVMNL